MSRGALGEGLRFGAGTAIASAAAFYWTLALPRQLSVEAFAEWRLFLLYGGFVAALHLGIPDAFLYRWTRRRSAAAPSAFGPVAGAIGLWHLAILAMVMVAAMLLPVSTTVRNLVPALAAYALVWNLSALAQVRLQAERRWTSSSLFTAVSALLFALAVITGALADRSGAVVAGTFVGCTALAAATTLAAALATDGSHRRKVYSRRLVSGRRLARTLRAAIRAGFPILVVNLLLLTLASADRMAVSIAFPRAAFATYAFSASLVAIVHTGAAVAGRFAVPYVAAWARDGTLIARYPALCLAIGGVWCGAVAVLLTSSALLARSYPQYSEAVPLSFLLLSGAAFSAAVQILQLPAARALGRTAASMRMALLAIGAGAAALVLATRVYDLAIVAAVGSGIAALWWAANSREVVRMQGRGSSDAIFLLSVVAVTLVAWQASMRADQIRLSISGVLLIVAGVCVATAARAMRQWPGTTTPTVA